MNAHILCNARIITPSQDFTGSVIIENGLITEIKPGKTYAEGEDLGGLWLAPGCIDIHSDYLEKEVHPRPSANFPLPMAFYFMDQRAAACGVTTVFSAISFSDNNELKRTFDNAIDRAKAIDQLRKTALVRHFVHARLDPNTNTVVAYLEKMKESKSLRLVVYNDSIPGQRQFDFEDLVLKRAKTLGISPEESRQRLMENIRIRSQINHRSAIKEAFGGLYPLGSHDDTTIAHVEEGWQYGATLSEMPTTAVAARKAKELGMAVCMGAPNYVRGGSHCGNLSCREAIAENLVDMLCSDYHFPSMLAAVMHMMQSGMSPSNAMNLVSLYPARFLGMDNTIGSIEVGKEADLVAFRDSYTHAQVAKVWVRGQLQFQVSSRQITQPETAFAE